MSPVPVGEKMILAPLNYLCQRSVIRVHGCVAGWFCLLGVSLSTSVLLPQILCRDLAIRSREDASSDFILGHWVLSIPIR